MADSTVLAENKVAVESLVGSGGSISQANTPLLTIQGLRRKNAGHGGQLTKILVANRGVRLPGCIYAARWLIIYVVTLGMIGNRHSCLQDSSRARDAHRCDLLLRRSVVRAQAEGAPVRFSIG
jgi:hypothetical protein